MRETRIADKNHPDYKEYKEKADALKKQYFKSRADLPSLNLSPKEEDRQFCIIHRKFMNKMIALSKEYEQIFTKTITEEGE